MFTAGQTACILTFGPIVLIAVLAALVEIARIGIREHGRLGR